MSEITRRDLIRDAAAAAALGPLTAEAAQHVHQAVAEAKPPAGVYKPKLLKAHEYRTLEVLTEIVVPGARKAGAPAFIDVLCGGSDEMAAIYTGGLAWLDRTAERRFGVRFADANRADQTALLDLIAHRKNESAELAAGVRFFDWVRRMTVDAYYTSPDGVKELGYKGNVGMTDFKVPQEAIDYALKKSGLA
jgi:gluconate 2-dehydrogenase gamma chain